jgi:hypothetical protein
MIPPLLRTSERKDWRRCPWLWEKVWLQSMRPVRPPVWSWFGTAWHLAMETRYPIGTKRGKLVDVIDTFHAAVGERTGRVYTELDESTETEIVEARQLGEQMLIGYVDNYGKDPEWEVIHTEQPFQIDVPHPTKPDKTVVVYAGTWDLLARHLPTGELWLWDHKTAKQMPQPRFLDLDDQAGSYLWVAREVLLHKGVISKTDVIEGIIFSYAKKALPDPRPTDSEGRALNKDGTISKMQPSPRFLRHATYRSQEQNVAQALRVIDEAYVMDQQRRGKLPIWKNPSQECNRCPLFDVCEMHERGEDWESLFRMQYHKDDVYADHREAMQRGGIKLKPTTL